MEIQIVDLNEPDNNRLRESLGFEIKEDPAIITFELRKQNTRYLDPVLDPTVLVAIIGVFNVGLTALIAGLFKMMENRGKKGIIVLVGKTGRRIEIPAGMSDEEISILIEKSKELDIETVRII
jgi:hypothetical protein